jgi:hypothetical protein
MRTTTNVKMAALCLLASLAARPVTAEESVVTVADYSKLPANTWVLIHKEDSSGGKAFARLIFAQSVDRLYLWGTGGKQPERNVFLRYELESFSPKTPYWLPAFPKSKSGQWTTEKFPPFRIYGQTGPDGLKYDEGPRLQVVGGYNATNRVRWWDFDGIKRPSPIHTFNMACWDSKRDRIVYYSDGCTFALEPAANTWTDLEAKNHPQTCRTVAWASMCYDPLNDQILLFGGGLATNPGGGAPTWLYNCTDNVWHRPKLAIEPPLRCNAPIVYDPVTESMIMFGGYDQAAALNDTWAFDCHTDRWEHRKPQLSPPPIFAPAAALVSNGGKILVCGNDARKIKLTHQSSTSADKETWIYDTIKNEWTPINSDLRLAGYRWLTAAGSRRRGVVFMAAFGPERRTYALRYDASARAADLPGAEPDTIAWKYPEQKQSLEEAPQPDLQAHAEFLKWLPPNKFVEANPPGMLISKTWSTAVIDTDRSEVIYTGGGHSGYSGNDFARYSIRENRWSLDFPPRFPPFLESTNAGIFGWSYGMHPFSQHTYLWYCYDPLSKTVVYLARPSLFEGLDVRIEDDPDSVFTYSAREHGYASWVYDSERKVMRKPSFGRPFANPWHLSLVGTPRGVYAMCNDKLYHGDVTRETGRVQWRLVDADFPKPLKAIKYHYEFQPIVHDTKNDRLIQLKGDRGRVDVYARSLDDDGKWQQLDAKGSAAIGREAVYVPRHQTVLWLGDKQLFALDCRTMRMSQVDIELPDGLYTHECAMVYDPAHDLCIALIPSRFSGPMRTFLYRFEAASASYR